MADENSTNQKKPAEPIKWAEFLAEVPPYAQRVVIDISGSEVFVGRGTAWEVSHPTILIYCTVCNQKLNFDYAGGKELIDDKPGNLFLPYLCRLCRNTSKTFAIRARHIGNQSRGEVEKMGELPAFGPPTFTRYTWKRPGAFF